MGGDVEARGGGGREGGGIRGQVTINYAQSAGSLVPKKSALKISGGQRVNSLGWNAQEGENAVASETPHMETAAAAADGANAPAHARSAGAQQPGVRGTGKGETGDGRGDSAHSAYTASQSGAEREQGHRGHEGMVGERGVEVDPARARQARGDSAHSAYAASQVDPARARQARAQEAVASTIGVNKGLQAVAQGDTFL